MGAVRFVCLGLPFALTFGMCPPYTQYKKQLLTTGTGSLICLIIVITGLHPNKEYVSLAKLAAQIQLLTFYYSYYFAKFDTANLSVSATVLTKRDFSGFEARDLGIAHLHTEALSNAASTSSSTSVTVNATELGIADSYTVGLWNYCLQTKSSTNGSTKQVCSKAKAEFAFDPFSIWNLLVFSPFSLLQKNFTSCRDMKVN